jgi:alkylated DNA repair dioxygenase AlkB
MNTLFPLEDTRPEGFIYHENFISAEEEQQLVNEIKKIELHTFIFQGHEAKRKVASFGYDYSFTDGTLKKGKDIPEVFHSLIKKVAHKLSLPEEEIAELLVTEYPVGSVINWHRDAPPFDLIAGISLLADCNFRLRPYEKEKQIRSNTISYNVKRRSLYVMKDEARSQWQHSIAAVKHLRYSITLRTLKK